MGIKSLTLNSPFCYIFGIFFLFSLERASCSCWQGIYVYTQPVMVCAYLSVSFAHSLLLEDVSPEMLLHDPGTGFAKMQPSPPEGIKIHCSMTFPDRGYLGCQCVLLQSGRQTSRGKQWGKFYSCKWFFSHQKHMLCYYSVLRKWKFTISLWNWNIWGKWLMSIQANST